MTNSNSHNGNGHSKRRTYSDKQIAEALAMVDACGGNILQASAASGVPRKTLESWAKGQAKRVTGEEVAEEMAELRHESGQDLLAKFTEWVWELLKINCEPGEMRKARYGERSTAIGIGFDKIRLLKNQSTAITDQRTSRKQASTYFRDMWKQAFGEDLTEEEAQKRLSEYPEFAEVMSQEK
mgnify:CR=1 FL=1